MAIVGGTETKVNTYVLGSQLWGQTTVLADGGWVVTWGSYGQDGSGYGVYQQAYAADGTARGGEVRVNTYAAGNQYVPQSTALADGGWVVTWMSDDGQDGSTGASISRPTMPMARPAAARFGSTPTSLVTNTPHKQQRWAMAAGW